MRDERERRSFGHERLKVYDESVSFAAFIYQVSKLFPSDERFGLTSQIRRASVSVVSNIAEGNARTMGRDKARFFEIAYGSLMEVVAQSDVATRLGFLPEDANARIRSSADVIARMLSGLRASVQ